MYETFKHFDALKFTNRCICCGTEIAAGSPGYGSNRTLADPGRWMFVCPPCFMRDAGRPIEVLEEVEETPEIPADLLEALDRLDAKAKSKAGAPEAPKAAVAKSAPPPQPERKLSWQEIIRESAPWGFE